MSRATARLARATGVGAAATLATLGGALPAMAHGGGGEVAAHAGGNLSLSAGAGATMGSPVPALTSGNVRHLDSEPVQSGAISGDFSTSGRHFYVSTLKNISVYDISDPKDPKLTGTTGDFVFENEAMNYGQQRMPNGDLRKFVLVGVDLYQASESDPQHVNKGRGKELVLVDVTNPNNPHVRSRADATSSTHTVACVQRTQCNYAYSAGSRGAFSIFDLRDWNNPKEVDSDPSTPGTQGFGSPALDPNEVFSNGAGHKWNFVGDDIAYQTGSGGSAAFDVSRPRDPQLLTKTTDAALTGPLNNFIHHNSWQPHVFQYKANAPAKLYNGNVLLVTEEDYEQTDCSKAGSFQTWKIDNFRQPKAIRPLDRVELTDLGGPEQGITPDLAFCSAHWFDYHENGIVAAAFYGGGTRLLDVRDPKNIKPFGFVQGAGQTWDAYWVPEYLGGEKASRHKTDLFYSVDLVRGLEVFKVTNMPAKRATER